MEDEEGHDEFRALCMAIGFVVLNWAMVEQQIDNWVNVAFINCVGQALRKTGTIPVSFSQKMDFLKECFKKLPMLSSFATEGRGLIARASLLAPERHNLVHGGIVSLKSENGAFRFRKVEYMKDNHAVSTFMFDQAAFFALETALGGLVADQIAFSQKLADRFLA